MKTRGLILGTLMAGACAVGTAFAQDRVDASVKGSLLVYSKVEIKWNRTVDGAYVVAQDTFLDISNDNVDDTDVQFYFVNGDAPTDAVFVGDPPVEVERAHEGWNWVDCQTTLTGDQPAYMSMLTGAASFPTPGFPNVGDPMCQPFTILDPGFPPGRPDPERRGGRILRGFVYVWAVGSDGNSVNAQRHWNHLAGDAILVNYALAKAAEYNAYAFQAVGDGDDGIAPETGDFIGAAGALLLNGQQYVQGFDKLLVDFYATGSFALSGALPVVVDTDFTLHPVSADLRQDTTGPVTTKAKYDIWNQNEVRFSGTEKCITCWDQTLASSYPAPNHLLRANLQTDKGKARIDGLGSTQCPLSRDASMLGITIKELVFIIQGKGEATSRFASSAITMTGQGSENATILYDLVDAARVNTDSAAAVPAAPVKAGGRLGRQGASSGQ
ncbi:MAG: hypothetical protein AABZ47_00925 [Planctomycetota bacterium]